MFLVLSGCTPFRGLPADSGPGDAGLSADGGSDAGTPISCPPGQSGPHEGVAAITRQLQVADRNSGTPLDFHVKTATLDRQGRVLLAGGIRGCLEAGRFAAAVVRLTLAFEVDPTFNRLGRVCIGATVSGNQTTAFALTVDEADRVVMAGLSSDDAGLVGGLLARWTSDGRLDSTFGAGGVVDYRPGANATSPGFSVVFHTLLVDRGRVVVAGSSSQPYSRGEAGLVVRFKDDGSVDPDFHAGAIFWDPTLSGFYGLAAHQNGYLVAGSSLTTRVRVLRLDEAGALDPTFGVGGVAEHSRGRDVNVRSLGLDGAGRIYVGGGRSAEYSASASPAVVVRLSPQGSPDLTYGERGEALLADSIWGFDYAFERSMMVRCDGTVFIGGRRGQRGTVSALSPAGRPSLEFGLDGSLDLPAPFPGALCGAFALWPGSAAGSVGTLGLCSTNQNQTYLELWP